MPEPESAEEPTQDTRQNARQDTRQDARRDAQEEADAARRRRRAQFLRELAEARELRDRVQPRRAKAARLRHAMRMRTFRW
ncbi:hypothetical protein [Streptomyces sp. HD]|uniref:hypothetical protein n=1 Tax=Streptomyces sp. HD TaxID=3020892 RepID=UPI00232C8774|nr:hypothetical protein [Streptomyces sp. HD]MDC0772427.1 hypothetical protein [Streptomyces sp. HD]